MDRQDRPHEGFDWAAAQRRYLESLAALTGSPAADGVDPWQKALEFWWRSVQPALPEDSRAMFNNLTQQSMLFFGLCEPFSKLVSGVCAAEQQAAGWQAEFERHLDSLKQRFEEMGTGAAWSPQALTAALRPGLDTFQRTLSALSVMPGDLFRAFRQPHAGEEQPQIPPALGYTREMQEQTQQGLRLWTDCQRHMAEYQAGMSQVAVKAVEHLKERILAMAERNEKLSSLRQLYDLWIECAEQAYGEHVFTDEYAQSYGRMVNSLVAFKHHSQQVVDDVLAAMNVPTHQGIDTMQRRQQEMRREIRRSAEERRSQDQTIAALRRELEELRAALNAGGRKRAAGSAKERTEPDQDLPE
ncbi:MAG: class III poly(R)-hydroxyalkanoic acid synthase subunit PhaE [Gammaproteobacteria bacterium]|nr:class III poly(R)-hydroxyalkanoic acid synthase subunit PhaE [Gammaproteobacteria bacterium]